MTQLIRKVNRKISFKTISVPHKIVMIFEDLSKIHSFKEFVKYHHLVLASLFQLS